MDSPRLRSSPPAPTPPHTSGADDSAAAAAGSPSPPPEEWLRTARRGLDEPVTWDGLRALLDEWRSGAAAGRANAARPLGRMGRSREATVAYRAHRTRVLAEWRTMSDYVTVAVLGWAGLAEGGGGGGGGGAKKAAAPLRPARELPRFLFAPNDYPYHFEPGAMRHELLWAPAPLGDPEVEAAVAERGRELDAEDGGDATQTEFSEGRAGPGGAGARRAEALWWVNPLELKSVPALWHVHVVFRRREGTTSIVLLEKK